MTRTLLIRFDCLHFFALSFELEVLEIDFSRPFLFNPPHLWNAVISFSRDFNLRHLRYRYIAKLFPDSLKTFSSAAALSLSNVMCHLMFHSIFLITLIHLLQVGTFFHNNFLCCAATKCDLIHHWMKQRNFTCWLSGKWDEGNCGVIKREALPHHQHQQQQKKEENPIKRFRIELKFVVVWK